jgi:hypothetical protein
MSLLAKSVVTLVREVPGLVTVSSPPTWMTGSTTTRVPKKPSPRPGGVVVSSEVAAGGVQVQLVQLCSDSERVRHQSCADGLQEGAFIHVKAFKLELRGLQFFCFAH